MSWLRCHPGTRNPEGVPEVTSWVHPASGASHLEAQGSETTLRNKPGDVGLHTGCKLLVPLWRLCARPATPPQPPPLLELCCFVNHTLRCAVALIASYWRRGCSHWSYMKAHWIHWDAQGYLLHVDEADMGLFKQNQKVQQRTETCGKNVTWDQKKWNNWNLRNCELVLQPGCQCIYTKKNHECDRTAALWKGSRHSRLPGSPEGDGLFWEKDNEKWLKLISLPNIPTNPLFSAAHLWLCGILMARNMLVWYCLLSSPNKANAPPIKSHFENRCPQSQRGRFWSKPSTNCYCLCRSRRLTGNADLQTALKAYTHTSFSFFSAPFHYISLTFDFSLKLQRETWSDDEDRD